MRTLIVLIMFLACSCSVIRAARSTPEPDLEAVRKAVTRQQVEVVLGAGECQDSGFLTECTYTYVIDKADVSRAINHIVLNLILTPLWEIPGHFIEKAAKEDKTIKVVYDRDLVLRVAV